MPDRRLKLSITGVSQVPSHSRSGSGPPLVLLHPGGTSWRIWTPLLPALAAQRDVFAPTLAGHIGGPPLPGGRVHFELFADIVERQLDEQDIGVADIAGNSIGGATAFELARRGRARRVVAIAPMGQQTDAQAHRLVSGIPRAHRAARRSRAAVMPALALAPARRRVLAPMMAHGDRLTPAMARHIVRAYTWCEASQIMDMQAPDGSYAQVERAAEIHAPTLLVWGDRDRTATRDQMDRYLMQLPDARLVEIPDAGHFPQLDEPEYVAELILQFTASR
jgi:pimeloyl-ACP methyl ester carboxylesterase